jgi:hypothetical protein
MGRGTLGVFGVLLFPYTTASGEFCAESEGYGVLNEKMEVWGFAPRDDCVFRGKDDGNEVLRGIIQAT